MKAIGIILATRSSLSLGSLASHRAPASIPMAGSFRALDFPISSMSNSGIKKIGIITQSNTKSIFDHLRSGKWWNIGRKKEGLFVLAPAMTDHGSSFYRGTADAIFKNIDFLKKSYEDYVVLTNADCIYKIDFNDMIEAHAKSGADITIAVQKNTRGLDMRELGNVIYDENKKLTNFEDQPIEPLSDTYFAEIYVFSRKHLIEMIEKLNQENRFRIRQDLLMRYRNHLNIQCYEIDNYWSSIATTEMYYKTNMDFLDDEIRNAMFREGAKVYTKPKDLPPVKYNFSATVKNSIVGRGSIIDGSVLNSVVFRDVKVGAYSTVRNSIVMESTIIGNNVHLENVIVDKGCIIENDVVLIGDPNNIKTIAKGKRFSVQDAQNFR